MSPIGQLAAVTLDAVEPAALADFYCGITGWKTVFTSEDFAFIASEDGTGKMGFQREADHHAPKWPSQDKQMHLDFSVSDLDEAEKGVLALGATKPDFQPGGDKWRVFADPAGHPFCVTTAA
ncbi:VOC family protein [Streptomyces sp. RKAG293]|uniref:VOC family protein n=1 Tax=Streptomyces sp. RKAG293 TaxID=2893403 RepID=UPI002033B5EC|nr:VOC family protein [Streptomyces sp. RKAG293]MCM2416770.1 VOC family protein [Streptomyces sp. RKAG293]